MLKPTVLFTVVATSFFIHKVAGAHIFDVQTFLKSLQQQLKEEQQLKAANNENYNNNNNDVDSYFGSLQKKDVDQLLYSSASGSKRNRNYNRHSKNDQHKQSWNGVHLNDYLLRRPYRSARVSVADLLALGGRAAGGGAADSDSRESREDDLPNEYSKVYVVLNSEALKKSRNKEKLNVLLSSLLSAPPRASGRPRRPRHRSRLYRSPGYSDRYSNRYKGFIVNANQLGRRANRDSKEIYVKESLIEKDPRPLRPVRPQRQRERDVRSHGSGGGAGGRTAIPYIRHRGGDIYERED